LTNQTYLTDKRHLIIAHFHFFNGKIL